MDIFQQIDFSTLDINDFQPLMIEVPKEHVGAFKNTDRTSTSMFNQEVSNLCAEIEDSIFFS